MSKNTNIEWTDSTFNPWEGCTMVSPGCINCYAENRNARFGGGTAPNWGKGAPRRRTSAQNWNKPMVWNREAAESGTRMKVFCASLADWLDHEVPVVWLADLLRLIGKTPHLDWQLLTKRPQNWTGRLEAALRSQNIPPAGDPELDWAVDWLERREIPANVWMGTTVEDQTRADERIPILLRIPANVRFLSCEPLLGPIRFADVRGFNLAGSAGVELLRNLWVICGGESGPKARPMHPDWARSIRDQCATVGVPFFFKQHGEYLEVDAPGCKPGDPPVMVKTVEHASRVIFGLKKPAWVDWEGRLFNDGAEFEGDGPFRLLDHVGKKAAGNLLDGTEHKAFPK